MKTKKATPDSDLLRRMFLYDPVTGRVKRRHYVKGARRDVGSKTPKGYITVMINGSSFLLHNLIWKMQMGRDPSPGYIVDHSDNIQTNNRWSNLREATNSQNSCNKKIRRDNTTGFKGVGPANKWGRHQAAITVQGKRRSLGYYYDPAEAHAAYVAASKSVHGEFARER